MTFADAPAGSSARDFAARLMESDAPVGALPGTADRHALAWALKDACYAAWSSAPQQAVRAAEALRTLCVARSRHAGGGEDDRTICALADWTRGIAHVTRGEMSEATRSLDRAADAFRSVGAPHRAAETQVPKIIALAMLGRHDEAIACAEQARRAFETHGDVLAAGKVALNLGSLQLRRDAYRSAIGHYRDAAVLLARAGAREHSIMADMGAGDALAALGDFSEALHLYGRARLRAQKHGFAVLEAHVEESLALVQLARGQYREALSGLERSRRHYETLAMPQHLAIAEKQLADAYLDLRLIPEALALFERSGTRFAALEMPDDEAWTHAQKARAFAVLRERAQAEHALAQATRLFAAQSNHAGLGSIALTRALLALQEADAPQALAQADVALVELEAANSSENVLRAQIVRAHALLAASDLGSARGLFAATHARSVEMQLSRVTLDAMTGLGLAAVAAGDPADAQSWLEQAVELFEELRRALPDDGLRVAFHAEHLRPYRELLELALDEHTRTQCASDAIAVLRRLDRFRAISLSEGGDAIADADDSTANALRSRANWLHRRARRLQDEGEVATAIHKEQRQTEHALLEHLRRRRFAAAPAFEPASSDDLDVAALQAALADTDALVEYGEAGGELFACVVTRKGVRILHAMARWGDLQVAVRAVRFQIDALRHGRAMPTHHMPLLLRRTQARLATLHALLWAPLETALDGIARVIIVPHGALAAVPFAALHRSGTPLAATLDIAFAPSARVAQARLGVTPPAPSSILAVGESSRLAHAHAEALDVAAHFTEHRVLLDDAASVEAFSRHAPGADVIHLACHGEFRGDNPRFSALHLHDALLTVERVESLRLRAAMVVLSACETAVSNATAEDEMIGLVRAFLMAGAHRVIATLWPIEDAVTASFMRHFYQSLRGGASAASALRGAQLETRKHHPHPFHWAAFTLHSGW